MAKPTLASCCYLDSNKRTAWCAEQSNIIADRTNSSGYSSTQLFQYTDSSSSTTPTMATPAFKQALDRLVQRITGFQPGSENHTVSVKFAVFKFKQQIGLATDPKEIITRCKGLAEKYSLRGDDTKADTILEAVAMLQNIKQPFFSTNVIFDIIPLLFNLSESATAHDYERLPNKNLDLSSQSLLVTWSDICSTEPLVGGHWQQELYENDSSDGWSLDENGHQDHTQFYDGIESPPSSFNRTDSARSAKKMYPNANSSYDDTGITTIDATHLQFESFELRSQSDMLEALFDAQYWTDAGRRTILHDVPFNPKDSCTLRPSIAYSESKNYDYLFRPLNSVCYVTEPEIIRESLFLLAGLNTTMFTKDQHGLWQWKNSFDVTHLTSTSLASIINEDILLVANEIEEIRSFISSVNQNPHSQTFSAFAASLSGYLLEWHHNLNSVEVKLLTPQLKSGEQTSSLMWLGKHINIHAASLLYIVRVIRKVDFLTMIGPPTTDVCSTHTAKLLNILFSMIIESELQGDIAQLRVLIELFVSTIRPLLDFLNDALNHGMINDQHCEFFLQVDNQITKTDANFWTHCIQPSFGAKIPVFMVPVVADIMHAMKISTFYASKYGNLAHHASESIADMFVNELGKLCDFEYQHEPHGHILAKTVALRWPDNTNKTNQAFDANSYHRLLFDTTKSHWRPFNHVVDLAMLAALRPPLQHLHIKFKDMVFTQDHFFVHLEVVHGVFLLLMPDPMTAFCEQLFVKMGSHERGSGELSCSSFALQAIFSEASIGILPMYCSHMDRFHLKWHDFEMLKTTPISPRLFFQNIKISYTCPWSLELVVGPSGWTVYSQVATFIMYINYACFCLQRARIRRRGYSDSNAIKDERETVGLRMKLHHFLISLRTYVLHGVLHSESSVLLSAVGTETTIDGLISLHSRFEASLSERLFLSDRAWPVLKEIYTILDMCIGEGSVPASNKTSITQDLISKHPGRSDFAVGMAVSVLSKTSFDFTERFGSDSAASSETKRLLEIERQLDDSLRFLVDSLKVMAAHIDEGAAVEILALSLDFKTEV
ncbi:hypothetical protein BASA81_010490 [Batrachochytrium salamandrivorans]|nr:hypothetical protein BASA81_010490 [Batrachochytrium salamandrivorans]